MSEQIDRPIAEKQKRNWQTKLVCVVLSYAIGLAVGALFHYTLYRMGLPKTPFIYMNF